MKFDISINDDVFKKLEKLYRGKAEALAIEVAQAQIVNIRMRVQRGVGLNDAPMPAYSQLYKMQRMQSGRKGNPRTLLWSGKMLRAMRALRVERTSSSVTVIIGFSDPLSDRKADANQRRAPWFGISQRDAARIRALMEKDL